MGFVKWYFPWIDCKVVHGIVWQGSFASLSYPQNSPMRVYRSLSLFLSPRLCPYSTHRAYTPLPASTCSQFVAPCVHFRKFPTTAGRRCDAVLGTLPRLALVLPRLPTRKARGVLRHTYIYVCVCFVGCSLSPNR